jgi:Ca-activated chloride channel homolog
MSPHNSCSNEELLLPYLEGSLNSKDRQAVESHLEKCEICSAMKMRLESAQQALFTLMPLKVDEVPNSRRTAILEEYAKIKAPQRSPVKLPSPKIVRIRPKSWIPKLMASTAALIFLGLLVGMLMPNLSKSASMADRALLVTSMQSYEVAHDTPTIVKKDKRRESRLEVSKVQMDELPTEYQYQEILENAEAPIANHVADSELDELMELLPMESKAEVPNLAVLGLMSKNDNGEGQSRARKNIFKKESKDKNSPISLPLDVGGTLAFDVKELPEGTKFSVKTPSAVAGVRGTQFSLDMEKNKQHIYKNVTNDLDTSAILPEIEQPPVSQTQPMPPASPKPSTHSPIQINPFELTAQDALSTFSLDSDTASYDRALATLSRHQMPNPKEIRVEEFVNAFTYGDPLPTDRPFALTTQLGEAPNDSGLSWLRIGVNAKGAGKRAKAQHVIIILDTSSSMDQADRLPLVKTGLQVFLNKLSSADHCSLITFGDRPAIVAEYTKNSADLVERMLGLQASGSTDLSSALELALQLCGRYRNQQEDCRLILLSDGVATIGDTDGTNWIQRLSEERKRGVSLSTVGFGGESYNDGGLEQLANKMDGRYFYVANQDDALRVMGDQLSRSLTPAARDARIQVVFNPKSVRRYRLLGYENRAIKDHDFRNDSIDAGEVGFGQCVSALYELEVNDSVAQQPELGVVYLRYRNTENEQMEEMHSRINDDFSQMPSMEAQPLVHLPWVLAGFAELLRESPYVKIDYDELSKQARSISSVLKHPEPLEKLVHAIETARELNRTKP